MAGGWENIILGVIFIKAQELNLSGITRRFSAISGLEGDELSKASDFILSAKLEVERILTKEPSREEYALCEYCAGCIANYGYVCALLSKPSEVVTENGVYTGTKPENGLLSSALALKKQALAQISHLTSGNDFVFIQA